MQRPFLTTLLYLLKKAICFILLLIPFSICCQTDLHFDLLWEEDLFPRNPYTIEYDQLERPYFYVANDLGGLLIYRENPMGHQKIKTIGIEHWDSLQVMNLSQDGEFLYLALGSFFSSGGSDFGMAVIDVSDPESAFVSAVWTHDRIKKGSAIVITNVQFAFLGAMNDGVYIFDISNPDTIVEISQIKPDPDFPVLNPRPEQEPNARGMAVKDNYLYLCYDAGGIRVINLDDIFHPFQEAVYINESLLGVTQQAYNNILIHNDYAYTTTDYCGLEILDISDPLKIKRLSWWNPWNCESPDNFWLNSPGHTNELAFLPGYEGDILLVNGNDQELIGLDVEIPEAPRLVDWHGDIGDNIRTWGFGTKQDTLMAAYYFTLLPWLSSQARIKEFRIEKPLSSSELPVLSINISPNPSQGRLNIRLPQYPHASIDYEISNILGRCLQKGMLQLIHGVGDINLADLKTEGLYFLTLTADGQKTSRSFYLKSTN